MQCLVPDPKADYRSVVDALNKIVRHEGIRNTVRGFSAMAVGAGPAHALYFACYEKVKQVLSGGKQGNHFAHGTFLVLFLLSFQPLCVCYNICVLYVVWIMS